MSTNNRVVLDCAYCGRKDAMLSVVEGKGVCEHCKFVVTEANIIRRGIARVVNVVEKGLVNLHNRIMNSSLIVNSAEEVIKQRFETCMAMREATRFTARMYAIEGQHLSHKEATRSTWYTNPVTALEIGEYIGRKTGRLVYVDLEIDMFSEVSRRFYQLGSEAFTLTGELMYVAKRKWKYATDRDIAKSNMYIAHLQASAGMQAELENNL
jgi:hypothetical protein